MFLILWEFEVKPGGEERFEKVYGPGGDWAQLFRSGTDHRETRLLHDSFRPVVYVTMDFWNSQQAYEEFLRTHHAEYQAIEALGEKLTVSERRIGAYELVSP
jgi:heme-degrading monooxygenase HmoA